MATGKSTASSTRTKKTAPLSKKTSAAAVTKSAGKSAKAKLTKTGISPDERSHMIAEAAYFRAEQRGFDPQGQVDDWLEAEAIIDDMLSQSVVAESSQRH